MDLLTFNSFWLCIVLYSCFVTLTTSYPHTVILTILVCMYNYVGITGRSGLFCAVSLRHSDIRSMYMKASVPAAATSHQPPPLLEP
ncbi:hypothetical protein EDB19DRAFT_368138 [Suillus lakei]|nr:hypothetical protein EDB19DRAFT_368138 [Suillus lakei]